MPDAVFYGGAALLVVVVLLVMRRGAGSLPEQVGRGLAAAAGDAGVGVIKGIGEAVGIPDTDPLKCARALAEGRMWDASFDCPAADFFRGLVGIVPQSATLDRPGGGGGATGGW
jgi:hypothetical protein